MNLTFRQAIKADFDLTLRIKTRSLKPYIEGIWGWDEEIQKKYHQQNFQPGRIQIIGNGTKEFGFIELDEKEKEIFLINLLIEEDYQGNGISQRIIDKLISQKKKLHLEVLKINHRAKAFYEKNGFIVVDKTELKWVMERVPESL